MKKKTLLGLLGGAVIAGLAYYIYTMNKVSDIDEDNLEDDDLDEEDEFFEDDLDLDFDNTKEHKTVQFDNINTDNVFQEKNPINHTAEEDEGEEIESPIQSVIADTPVNVLDYDSSYFELVCNISREDAIRLIMKERDNYTEEELAAMTNSELAEIYSEIINN